MADSPRAWVIDPDCGDLVALAITEAQQLEAADLRPGLPVMTVNDVERVGAVLRTLGGHIEGVRRP